MNQSMPPQTCPLDFGFLEDSIALPLVRAEVLDRRAMALDLSSGAAMLLLFSAWPPPRVRERAARIVAAAIVPGLKDAAARRALDDLAERWNESTHALLHQWLYPAAVVEALDDISERQKRWQAAHDAAPHIWNEELRAVDPMVMQEKGQCQQLIQEVSQQASDLEPNLLGPILMAMANEVAAVVARQPDLAGEVVSWAAPVRDEWRSDAPNWDLDPSGTFVYGVATIDWAADAATDLVRRVLNRTRRNLREWGYHRPQMKRKPASQEVTARRVTPPQSSVGGPASNPADAVMAMDTLISALDAVTPHERAVLQLLVTGLSPEEIAHETGRRRGAVYKVIQRLRPKIAPLLRG